MNIHLAFDKIEKHNFLRGDVFKVRFDKEFFINIDFSFYMKLNETIEYDPDFWIEYRNCFPESYHAALEIFKSHYGFGEKRTYFFHIPKDTRSFFISNVNYLHNQQKTLKLKLEIGKVYRVYINHFCYKRVFTGFYLL